MKKSILSAIVLLPMLCSAAVSDPVIMTVAGKDVKRSEFEYFFFKNNTEGSTDKKTLSEYADLFVNFKLKVAAAEDAGLDTTQSFLDEYREYRGIQAEDYLVDQEWLDSMALEVFKSSQKEVGPKGIYDVSMISVMPKSSEPEDLDYAKQLIDSIYGVIKEGADFNEVAAIRSQDGVARNGGKLGWVSKSQLPAEISEVVFNLEPGEMSEPYFSQYGWQIFKVDGQQLFNDFEEHRESIFKWMESNGFRQESMKNKAAKIAREKGWNVDADSALAILDSQLEDTYPEFALISQEYHDGLLLFDISSREIWDNTATDTVALTNYFESNREKYVYQEPKFNGLILFCRSEQVFEDIKVLLEGVPQSNWLTKLVEYNSDSISVRVLRGPFVKGENAYCDKAVFGTGECTPLELFPYLAYIGNVNTEPSNWEDVAGQVVSDLQSEMESQWVDRLRKTYKFKINKRILSTVGRHD